MSKKKKTKVISGVVLDEFKEPLAGTMVINRRTSKGASCDKDGKFSIDAAPDDILSFSMIGFAQQELKVTHQTDYKVVMREQMQSIKDAVVIGYGQVRHSDMTGSVAVVDMNEILKAPVISFDQALAGRIAG